MKRAYQESLELTGVSVHNYTRVLGLWINILQLLGSVLEFLPLLELPAQCAVPIAPLKRVWGPRQTGYSFGMVVAV